MTQNDTRTYEFDSVNDLLGMANNPNLHAEEDVLYVPMPDADPNAPLSEIDGLAEGPEGEPVVLGEADGYKAIRSKATGELWNTVTDEYEIINPQQFVGPLVEELEERDRTDVTGEAWSRNGGGSVYAQILFSETDTIHLPGRGRSDPLRCGFEVRWSHDSGMSVRAEGFAQDTACTNSIREITSPIYVKHAGDVNDRVDWHDEWAQVLDQLGAFSDRLAGVIEDAMEYTFFDFREDFDSTLLEATDPLDTLEDVDVPTMSVRRAPDERDRDGVYGFYSLAGLPKYLAVEATDRLMWRLSAKDDPREATAWDAYSGATYALTHAHRGVPGASDDDHFRAIKDVLMNPEKALADVEREALAECGDGAERRVGSAVPLTEAEIEDTTGEALRQYSERSRELEASFGGD